MNEVCKNCKHYIDDDYCEGQPSRIDYEFTECGNVDIIVCDGYEPEEEGEEQNEKDIFWK